MPKPSSSDTTRAHESWAEVRAHDQVMRYRRSGVGRAVLVLRSLGDPEPLWPELLEALGSSYRLIVPEPPSADADVAGWLADFLEGLGVSNVSILVGGSFCIPALELALLEGEQIARLVMVAEGRGTGDPGRGVLETALRRVAVPLLVVRRGQPAGEIVRVVTSFLAAEGTETAA
jgi:hypothetical protein